MGRNRQRLFANETERLWVSFLSLSFRRDTASSLRSIIYAGAWYPLLSGGASPSHQTLTLLAFCKADTARLFQGHEVSQYPGLESNIDLKANLLPWGIYTPSITLQDWSLKWMSSDVTASQDDGNHDERQTKKTQLWGLARKEAVPAGSQMGAVDLTGWVPGWRGKRSIVVADDAAFREKSKMLTAMERQKWLNSYMQKFLVVNSD
ncbi:Tuberoinfundibular peptide, partial [Ophiophagus hannah]